jgi:predicted nucleic acid-binding protein
VKASTLLDSNVLIAAVAGRHEHYARSAALINGQPQGALAVAIHSFAEVYSVLTNPSERAPFRWSAEEALAAIEALATATQLIGLGHGHAFDAIRAFASGGGLGPRLYDRLIGEAAVQNGIGRIATWNVKHMRSLFPRLEVFSPAGPKQ